MSWADIRRNHKEYEKNFEKMIKYSHDRLKQKPFLDREQELEDEGIRLLEEVGIPDYDPCPLTGGVSRLCHECNGKFYSIKKVSRLGEVAVNKGWKGEKGVKVWDCNLKETNYEDNTSYDRFRPTYITG